MCVTSLYSNTDIVREYLIQLPAEREVKSPLNMSQTAAACETLRPENG